MIPGHLDLLTAFVAVAEERSFTKTAVRLGVSTSAPSHAIRGFEESLGVRLLAQVGPAAGLSALIEALRHRD